MEPLYNTQNSSTSTALQSSVVREHSEPGADNVDNDDEISAPKRQKAALGDGGEDAELQQHVQDQARDSQGLEHISKPPPSTPTVTQSDDHERSDGVLIHHSDTMPRQRKTAAERKREKKQRYKRNQQLKKQQNQQASATGHESRQHDQETPSGGSIENNLQNTSFSTSASDLKTALQREYPAAFPWMIQRQLDTLELLFDDFIPYLQEPESYENMQSMEEAFCRRAYAIL